MNLFELAAVLTLNKSSYDKGIKDAKKEAEGFSGKMSGVVSGAAKGVTKAVGLAGAGIVKIIKDSVQAYGQYEQLKGGAEKIFEGMDTTKIMNDAKNAYYQLNMSASEYLESINLAGATFSKTMGNEKGYDTARKGMVAIADFASGTGKSITELNQKYQMITRAASSYQSIADQFSGILPQTSADFLAQAQAAGYLSKSYSKLTEVPVAEYQEAVTNMLYDGVDALNLTNNTAMESEKTLTGSFATVRAAWQNLVTGFSDKDANIGELVSNLLTSSISAIKNLLPTIQQAIKSIGPAIKDVIPQLIETAVGLVNDNLPMLIDAAVMLVTELGSAIGENVQPIVDAALHIVDMLVKYLEDPNGLLKLVDAAIEIIEKLASGLTSALPTLLPAVVGIIMTLAEKLTDPEMLENLVIVAIDLIEALVDGILAAQDKIIEMAPVIIKNLIEAIIRVSPRLVQASIEMIMQLVSGFFGHIQKLLEVGESIVDKVKEGFHSKVEEAKEWGKNLIDGFVKGVLAKWDELKSKVTGVVDFVKNIFTGKKGLDTHSPSRWAKKVFENVLEGAEIGLNSGENALYRKTDDLVAGVQDRFDNSYTASYSTGADGSVYALLAQYLPMLASLKVYLDSGVLVGQLTPGIDQALGRRAAYAARGNA